mmetsp:Transcript_36608/g.54709  ORF Transcript_36608/g.54709 Transcript_36608/m.54709 type:complete len:98 (-) Transcript_36608:76-369(-)
MRVRSDMGLDLQYSASSSCVPVVAFVIPPLPQSILVRPYEVAALGAGGAFWSAPPPFGADGGGDCSCCSCCSCPRQGLASPGLAWNSNLFSTQDRFV